MRLSYDQGAFDYTAQPDNQAPNLVSVAGEPEVRGELLKAVTVDPTGVAVIHNQRAQTHIALAAVRIGDRNVATHIPFMKPEAGALRLGLPAEKPSKLGFFIGYTGSLTVRAVTRLGYYPGIPLATHTSPTQAPEEMVAEVAGLRDYELDEKEWAQQIGLWGELGFDENCTRGLFSWTRYTETKGASGLRQSRIVVVPDNMTDLVSGPEAGAGGSNMQILAYTTDNLPSLSSAGVRPPDKFDDLQIKCGPSFEVSAPVLREQDQPKHLLGAFAVAVVPR